MRLRGTGPPDVAGAIDDIVAGLRSGLSLRQAVRRTAERDGSPLAGCTHALHGGRPLADSLRELAASTDDSGLASAMCVLAVHADTGGDPLSALSALAARHRRRAAARREARALTTQARLGARVILLLTPGFWLLFLASDPAATAASLSHPGTRGAVALGVALQIVGAVWISGIVRGVVPRPGAAMVRLPVLRAARALVAGRERSGASEQVAEAAETIAFVVTAGVSASRALEVTAAAARGEIGERLRLACELVAGGSSVTSALEEALGDLDAPAAGRLVRAVADAQTLGVPLAVVLHGLADEVTERSRSELAEDVRRASVHVLVPLSLFVLPAFVLACLVPLLAGGLGGITG